MMSTLSEPEDTQALPHHNRSEDKAMTDQNLGEAGADRAPGARTAPQLEAEEVLDLNSRGSKDPSVKKLEEGQH